MTQILTVKLKLLSDALIASGEGQGALIDSDVLFDSYGLPYIPGRRFKGCLREAAREVQLMLKHSDLSLPFDIEQVFGLPGQSEAPQVYFSGLYPPDYDLNRDWLYYLQKKNVLTPEDTSNALCDIRYQIAIEDDPSKSPGVTKDHSLRTMRVLSKDFVFEGSITVNSEWSPLIKNTLLLAAQQLEDIGVGAKRKRGFGWISCELWHDQKNLSETLDEVWQNA